MAGVLEYAGGGVGISVDSWVDIEDGSGTLNVCASVGANELPWGNVVHEGPALQLADGRRLANPSLPRPPSDTASFAALRQRVSGRKSGRRRSGA